MGEFNVSTEHAPFLDPDYYRTTYGGQLEATGLAPSDHFLRHGAAEGLRPNDRVDPLVLAALHHDCDVEAALRLLREAPATTTDDTDLQRIVPMEKGRALRVHASAKAQADGFVKPSPIEPARARVLGQAAEWSEQAGPVTYHFRAPAIGTFIDDIRAERPFAFVKLPHGLWDSAAYIERLKALLDDEPALRGLTSRQRARLAIRWGALLIPRHGNFSEGFFDDLFLWLRSGQWRTNVRCGLALTGFPTLPNGEGAALPPDPDRTRDRFRAISDHFPTGTTFHDGTLIKRWVISGDLSTLFAEIRDRSCLLIGPQKLDCLRDRAGLPNLRHYVIADAGSQRARYRILREVAAELDGMTETNPVVLSQCGGAFAFWLLTKLRERAPHGTFLDMGQALNAWALDRSPSADWLAVYGRALIENNDLTETYGGRAASETLIARLEAR